MSEDNKTAIIVGVSILTFTGMVIGGVLWANEAPYRFALQVQENTLACYDKVDASKAKDICGPLPTAVFPEGK